MKQIGESGLVLLALSLCCGPASAEGGDAIFRDRVVPILQRRCLGCHNDTDRKGGFSVQTAESVMADGYIEPGDAEASHLVDAVTPIDGEAHMPQDAEPLSAEEIAAIRSWIEDGAKWPANLTLVEPRVTDFDWWSYNRIRRPQVPELDSSWVRTPIDAFILDKLNQKNLTHADESDRRTLIRRLTYDLIGLPPTPEATTAFLTDPDPRAYEKLVDRLLESSHYGERWARHWLDVVKYADTCGYDKDKLRPNAWPYRDYVIRSFNNDKPYSRFIQEQIAGDVLFPGEPDGILGLGFIAAGPWDFIGHVEVPESKIDGKVARNLDRDDMVSNTLNTFCSVTVQCARCHNHKFDPVTQEHYYGLQSIFAAVDRAERRYDTDPKVERRRQQLESQLTSLRNKLRGLEREMAAAGGPQLSELTQQIKELQPQLKVRKDPQFGYHSALAPSAETEKWVELDLGQVVDIAQIIVRPCHDEYAGIGAGFGFPIRFKVAITTDGENWHLVSDQTQQDYPNPGLSSLVIDDIGAKARRVRFTATKLAERKNDYILALAELEVLNADRKNRARGVTATSLDSIEAPVRWSRNNLTDGLWARAGAPELAGRLAQANRARDAILSRVETPERTDKRASLQKSIKDAERQLRSLPEGQLVYAAATHFKAQSNFKPTGGRLRPVYVLQRGNVQQPREPAIPCVLPFDHQTDCRFDPNMNESERRATLARWLTRSDHPLVWRSIVNRIWQYHFGQGIVTTPNDFGHMGAEPSHPELLDWLATEFRDGGQSFKALHRLIVTSSVYRQSSRFDVAHAAIDKSNQYLWRMSRRRLEAEEIRDSILAVSGVLDPQMGGPGFYLFQLEKAAHSPHYEYHKFDPTDKASHRRSIYRFIVRSQPDPWMTTLDCADSSQSTPTRNETLTSLQALSLLNNQFNLVMAERFARRLEGKTSNLREQVEQAVKLVAQRPPTQTEREELATYAQTHGLANLCRMLFNLSEFVYLD